MLPLVIFLMTPFMTSLMLLHLSLQLMKTWNKCSENQVVHVIVLFNLAGFRMFHTQTYYILTSVQHANGMETRLKNNFFTSLRHLILHTRTTKGKVTLKQAIVAKRRKTEVRQ